MAQVAADVVGLVEIGRIGTVMDLIVTDTVVLASHLVDARCRAVQLVVSPLRLLLIDLLCLLSVLLLGGQ